MNVHVITRGIIFEILSEMVESGELTLGWKRDIKEFELDVVDFMLTGDYFCTLLYSENGKTLSKSVVVQSERVLSKVRDKKLDSLGI